MCSDAIRSVLTISLFFGIAISIKPNAITFQANARIKLNHDWWALWLSVVWLFASSHSHTHYSQEELNLHGVFSDVRWKITRWKFTLVVGTLVVWHLNFTVNTFANKIFYAFFSCCCICFFMGFFPCEHLTFYGFVSLSRSVARFILLFRQLWFAISKIMCPVASRIYDSLGHIDFVTNIYGTVRVRPFNRFE